MKGWRGQPVLYTIEKFR